MTLSSGSSGKPSPLNPYTHLIHRHHIFPEFWDGWQEEKKMEDMLGLDDQAAPVVLALDDQACKKKKKMEDVSGLDDQAASDGKKKKKKLKDVDPPTV
ncbi:hypothetical protein DM860_007086 [Cuscuta australis]|uniref:Uncharacterized protein n=1 Tax=Cuscuta australis TaxID=267555 RepID=A0A328E5W3_9ASTE|nr:hypothetical protein DM860_007086 [Cuscuta australis]